MTMKHKIVAIRQRLDLTQEQFAERLGVSPGHVGDLERGRRIPSIALASRMAELAGRPDIVNAVVAEKSGH